jgi:hypothetical protein
MMIKIATLFASLLLLSSCSAAQKITAEGLYGDWTGESKCVGSNPYCHDEIVLYHLTRSKNDVTKINLSADKIVNGKPEFMGEFDMTFDAEKMTLTAEFTIKRTGGKGVWLFKVEGDKMDGTLTVFPENEIGRKVSVTRKKDDPK